jgi:DNA-directed RNA polymerase specialized sigma24 family protein
VKGARLKADVTVRSRDEIADMIRALTDAQWIRLRKASRYFAWIYDLSADDLLQEAFCRALTGGRQCPAEVDVVRFLVQAMRSIANGEGDKVENQIDTVPVVQPGAPAGGAVELQDSSESQEETMIAIETAEATRQAFLDLFPDDPQARDLVDGILAGYQGEELRALTDLNETNYASKRRFMRRTIDKHYPTGKKL